MRPEIAGGGTGGASKRLSSEVEVTMLGELPSKCVMFDIASGSNLHESTSHGLLGVANVGHSSSQFDGTDYGASELESITRRQANEATGARVSRVGAVDVLTVAEGETREGLSSDCTK